MRVQPFSFLEQVDTTPVGPSIPKEANILFRYEDVNTNNDGTNWLDISPNGYTTSILGGGNNGINATENSVFLNNSNIRNNSLKIQTNTNIVIKTIALIYNQPFVSNRTGSSREYFWDFRKANTQNPNNAAYFNQYDSISTAGVYAGGTFYSYDSFSSTTTGPLDLTPTNVTDGNSNSTGGDDVWQWMGENGRGTNFSRRLQMYNFGTGADLNLTTSAAQGLVFGNNDNTSEGSSFNYYTIVGWDTYLDATDYSNLLAYFQSLNVIT